MLSLPIIDEFLQSVLSVSPGGDSTDALVSWFCDNSPQSVYKLAKSRSRANTDHDVAHLQPPTNVPAKYQLSTPYAFRDIAQTRFYRSRSLRQGQRSNQGNTMTVHTYTP